MRYRKKVHYQLREERPWLLLHLTQNSVEPPLIFSNERPKEQLLFVPRIIASAENDKKKKLACVYCFTQANS